MPPNSKGTTIILKTLICKNMTPSRTNKKQGVFFAKSQLQLVLNFLVMEYLKGYRLLKMKCPVE